MTAPSTAAVREVLASRRCSHAAVLVVTLRGGHWPYSCGLASSVRVLSPVLSAAGAEVVLLAAGDPERLRAFAAAWRLPFDWLPARVVQPLAEELNAWDPMSARVLDSVAVLGPGGSWLVRQDFEDPGGGGSLDVAIAALRRLRLPAVPAPVARGPAPDEIAGPSPQVLSTLRRAHAAAERLVRRLPPSPNAERAERTRLRLAQYLHGVETIVSRTGSFFPSACVDSG